MPRMHRLTRLVGVVMVVSVAFSAAGCSNKTTQKAVRTGPPPVPYVVKVTTVTGKLSAQSRKPLRSHVGVVIRNWWLAAYLQSGSANTFGAFTPGAAKLAQRDADLLSDPARKSAAWVEVRHQGVDLDVLAVKGKAKGVTARLHLVYEVVADGDKPAERRRCNVGGTVSLTPVGASWRIFGYDVTHTCHPRKAGS